MNYPNFKVCCRCFTFNQSMYITDTMNGFIMQQTSFPFVCTIVDDASTDGEQEVIRKYVDENFDFSEGSVAFNKETDYAFITFAQHKTNKNCYFAVLYLKENHYSKGMGKQKMSYLAEWRDMCEYEALCEGDDYWIVPDKLEKQVSILDEHDDYAMCATEAIIQSESGILNWRRYNQDRIVPINDIIEKGGLWLQTATYLFRKGINSDMIDCGRKCHVGDYPLIIWCAMKGNVYYLSDKTALYRFGYGWTKSFNEKDISTKIKGWKSELDMLKGFDSYSSYKYHDSFLRRRKRYFIFWIISPNSKHIDILKDAFSEEYNLLSYFERLDCVMMQYGCYIIPRIRRKAVSLINKILH